MLCLEILHFLDMTDRASQRRDMVLSSAVSSGVISAVEAWPEYFSAPGDDPGVFPSTGSDMSAFQLERATPESFAADMEAIVAASRQVTVREEPAPEFRPSAAVMPHPEWT
jgi:hypothetical protein